MTDWQRVPVSLREVILNDTMVIQRMEKAQRYTLLNEDYWTSLEQHLCDYVRPDKSHWLLYFKIFACDIKGGPFVGVYFELMNKFMNTTLNGILI